MTNANNEESNAEPQPVEESSTEKPTRNPVEKVFVWGLIAVGLVVILIEGRARLGYMLSRRALTQKFAEIDETSEDIHLSLEEAKSLLVFGPAVGEVEPYGLLRQACTAQWFSLAKEYEVKLIIDEEDGFVTTYETADPPEEELAELPATDEADGESPPELPEPETVESEEKSADE